MKINNEQGPKRVIDRQGRSLIRLAIAILIVLGLVFGGWGTVYAAQDAEPDDLLYPVKVAVDYLADFTAATISLDEPVSIQRQDRDLDHGMMNVATDVEEQKQFQYRWGEGWADEEIAEPLLNDIDLTIDDTLKTTPTMSGTQVMSRTQVMSGTLSMTRVMSGTLNGPGQCVGDTENCPLEIPLGYTHTFTGSLDAPNKYKGDVDQQPVIDYPDPGLGFGPGESTPKEVQEPSENKGSTGEQQKGGKP
jgi:hypothetical protein